MEGYSPGDHKESDTTELAHTRARRVQGPAWVRWVPPSLTSEPPCLQKLSTLVSLRHSQGLLTPSETQNTAPVAPSSEFLRPEPWSLGCPPRPASTQGLASPTSVLQPASSWPSSRLGVQAHSSGLCNNFMQRLSGYVCTGRSGPPAITADLSLTHSGAPPPRPLTSSWTIAV